MFTKIYNLFRQPAANNQVLHDGYLPYFDGDNFPLKWAKAISDSPSATSCLSTLSDFMEGFGFSDEDLENEIVDSRGGTMFQLHQKTVKEFAQNEGFFWLLRYDATFKISHWEVLPFENCRLGKPDDNGYISKIFYNPFFGTSEYAGKQKGKTKIYDVFNPKVVRDQYLAQGDKYLGQVLFVGTTTAMSRFYPLHEAYASIKWMKIESGVSDYHEDNINNGFLQHFILLMKGNPNDPSTNPEYQNENNTTPVTVAQEFDEVISKNFMGAKRSSNMMVQWIQNEEEEPKVIPMPSNANGDLFVTLDNQATKKITIAWKVPAILANIHEGVSLGGDANQVRVAVKLMQQRVVKKQRVLTDNYSVILKLRQQPYLKPVDIVPYDPYPEDSAPDDKVWSVLTVDEKRDWVQDNTEIDLLGAQPTTKPAVPATPGTENAIPVGFPEHVRKKVKKTLEYMDKMGLTCGGKSGRKVSEDIVNNANMGVRQLKRIYNYLKKGDEFANALNNEGCHVIEYNAWGGKEMHDFLEAKIKDIDSWLN